jgi:hypothetical protein
MLMELDSLVEDRLMALGKIEKSKQKMTKAYKKESELRSLSKAV